MSRPDSSPEKPIAVAGASGYVGGRLLDRLLAEDRNVRAIARNPAKLAGRYDREQFEVVRADTENLDSLVPALDGVGVAFYLVHSLGSAGDFDAIDERSAENFARACEQNGVERIVYLSGLGSDDDKLSEHLSSRHRTGDALRRGAVPVTELRAAIIVGSGSASFEIIRDLSRKLPVMITPRWVQSRCEPIGIRDVISYLVGVLDEPRTVGETLEIGGGDVLSYADMMRICAEEQGRSAKIFSVPVLTPRLSSYWLHLVTSVDMRIARPLIEGLRNDVVCNDRRIREWIPLQLGDYRTSVQRAFERERTRTVRESRWTDAAWPEKVRSAGSRLRIRRKVERFCDQRSVNTELSQQEAFRRLSRIGGEFGYGRTADFLWRVRGLIDRLGGGPGLRRGRPFGQGLHVGDAIDFWRVSDVHEPDRLGLVAEMWVPGQARLDWRVEPDGNGTRIVQTATLTNESLLSGLYWYAVAPLHNFVFDRLQRHLLSD